ncbi:MAG: glycosyltransferase family 4 protein, partial [Sulfurovaceae bacterium]|nr:glycosyltransferase family 4 protein [Sulfurovaceae bacterium]
TLHGSDVNHFTENKILRFIVNKTFILTNTKTICVGKKLASNFYNKFYLKSNYILSAGVDNRIFIEDDSVKKIYDFIFVGSFTKIKGIDILIEAIKETSDDFKWCFIGQGEYLNDLEELRKNHNIKIWHSLTHIEIAKELNRSKFFILPSRTEGFPLASIEALYCGIPVISSNLEQFKEQIKHNYNGFIIEENTIQGILKVLDFAYNLKESEYIYMKKNALNSNKQHSLENICNKLTLIYQKI